MFSIDLADEYRLARDHLGLTDNEMAILARASLLASGAPAAVVGEGIAEIDDWLGDGNAP